jgi:hypothetical protein
MLLPMFSAPFVISGLHVGNLYVWLGPYGAYGV